MRILTLVALIATGCVPSIAEVAQTTGPGGQAGSITIPVVPVDEIPINGFISNQNSGPSGVLSESWHRLAFGAGYPTSLTFTTGDIFQSRCLWEGTWIPEEVRSSDPSVVEVDLDGDALAVDVVGEGIAEVRVTGIFDGGCPWEGFPYGRQRLIRVMELDVRAPADVQLERPRACESEAELLLLTDAPLAEGIAVRLTSDGAPWLAENAREDRQVEVTLSLPDGTTATPPSAEAGLDGVVFHGAAGEVGISAPTGFRETVRVANPADVTGLDLALVVPWAVQGGDYVLEDGETLSWSDVFVPDEPVVAARIGVPRVGAASSCAEAPLSWLELESDPPQAEVSERSVWADEPLATQIVTDGAVTLTLRAPQVDGGEGLEHRVRVTFTD